MILRDVVELFAGPGGWSEGLRSAAPAVRSIGLEWDENACATARAAGHERVLCDVSSASPPDYLELGVEGLIASPPCQGFSLAGSGEGRRDSEMLLDSILECNTTSDVEEIIAYLSKHMRDPRSILVLEPLRWALTLRPEWMAWEQVPAVLPIWSACATVLSRSGYSTDTGILNSEQFGVPQTRRRAILVARLDGQASLPLPTHSKFHSRTPERMDRGVLPWVSMSEALGWESDYAVQRSNYSKGGKPGSTAAQRGRTERTGLQPSVTMTSKGFSWAPTEAGKNMGSGMVKRHGDRPGRSVDSPSFTVRASAGGTEPGGFVWKNGEHRRKVTVREAGLIQTFPADYPWQGGRMAQYRQVGDAVPPLLAQRIIEQIREGV